MINSRRFRSVFPGSKHYYILIIAVLVLLNSFLPVEYALCQDQEGKGIGLGLSFSPFDYLRYNRVEGAFAGGLFTITSSKYTKLKFHAGAGYGFKSEEPRYTFKAEYSFDPFFYKTISFAYFDETGTNDHNVISGAETNLAALLIHEDFRDYFRVKGITGNLNYNFIQNLTVNISFEGKEYFSMTKTTDWSIFGDDKVFRENPRVLEGREQYISAVLTYENREDLFIEANFWKIEAGFEKEFKDYDFYGLKFNVSRTQFGFDNQTLLASLSGEIREGTAAEQYLFDLGGIGTLRGYRFKEYTGNRRFMFSCEYLFNGDLLQKIPLQRFPLYSSLRTGVFFDAGLAWIENGGSTVIPKKAQTGNSLGDIKSGAGVSLFVINNLLRFDFAKRFDRGKDVWEITMRLLWKI